MYGGFEKWGVGDRSFVVGDTVFFSFDVDKCEFIILVNGVCGVVFIFVFVGWCFVFLGSGGYGIVE